MFTNKVKDQFPKAYKYFEDYQKTFFKQGNLTLDFTSLPFELQLGLFISFFDSISMDFQFYSTNQDALKETVLESFATYEEYLFLDS